MAIKITERFAQQCSVVVGNSYDTCGTMTRSSLAYMNATSLAALFVSGGLFVDFDAWFKTAIEMKACGTKTYGLYEWIMSGVDRGKGKLLNVRKADKSSDLIHPFILARQDSVINQDYWAITAGVTGDGVTVGGFLGVTGDRIISVVSRYGIDPDAQWFVNRDTVQIFTKSAGGAAEQGQWQVLASDLAGGPPATSMRVLIRPQNAGSTTPSEAAPVDGVLLPGVNNVTDFESWCQNRPTIDPRKRVPFWIQTNRRSRCVDSNYKQIFAKLMESNRAFAEFGDLSLAERNRQDEREYQRRFVNSFLFNKPLQYQTLNVVGGNSWENLEAINTLAPSILNVNIGGSSGKLTGRRANFVGVFEQLQACSRVWDLGAQALNLYEFFDLNYDIARARKSQGRPVTDIDWFTDSPYRSAIQTAMIAYYQLEYAGMLRLNVDLGKTRDDLGIVWDSYYVKHPAGIRINILSHEFFDDFLAAHKAENQESRGRHLLALDWGKGGSIYWAQIASNRKVVTTGDLSLLQKIDPTYKCVMENFTEEVTMTSETGTAVVECPANSAWLYNLSGVPPITTGVNITGGDTGRTGLKLDLL